MFWKQPKVSAWERKKDFLGVEWMPYVSNAEPGQFTQYVPTPEENVKEDTWISMLDITAAKFRLGMYPIQKALKSALSLAKDKWPTP